MKQRIFLGLAPIFIICVGIGLYAIWLFSRLGGAVDVILRENYQRVRANQAMKESAERMDSALSLALAGEEERGRKLFATSTPVFEENLRHTRGSISLPGEGEVAEKINQAEERYQGLAKKFWNTSDLGTRRTLYFSQLVPLFAQIQNNLQDVIRIGEPNMVQADHGARTLSARSTRNMVLVWVVGAGIALFLVVATERAILKPIQNLMAVAKELGNGNLDQVAAVQSNDEIAALAAAFNKLSAKLRAYRQITADQILQARQMTEITFAAFPDAILALSVYGTIDFANPAALELLKGLDSLKTPLSSIRMGLHLLLEEKIGPLNPKQLELLLAAREDSERLLRMINDLLDLARLESGQTRQRFEIISPTTLTKNASPNLMPLVEANDARLVTDIAPELPDVAVDLRQIGHVFSGGIGLQSTSGKGSEFYFDLPATSNGVKA